MLQFWTCEACGVSNQMVVSLLKPPPDTVMRICTDCEHEQEVRISERVGAQWELPGGVGAQWELPGAAERETGAILSLSRCGVGAQWELPGV